MHHTALPIVAAAALAAVSPPSWALDFTIRMKTDAGATSTYYIRQNAVRYTNASVNSDVIYRLDENVVILLDTKSNTYRKVSPSETFSGTGKSGGGIPPQQKEVFRRMGFDAAPTVTRLGPGETIAGYATEKYLVATPAIRAEILVAPSLEMPAAYYDANPMFKKAAVFDMTKFDQEMRKIKGAVLKRSMTMSLPGGMGGQRFTETAISVDRNPIPPSTFDIPASYRAVN
jgi:hypothetical protein